MFVHFVYMIPKVVILALFDVFRDLISFSRYSGENCTCMGRENTNDGHFVVQRADLIVARARFPCGPRSTDIYACIKMGS